MAKRKQSPSPDSIRRQPGTFPRGANGPENCSYGKGQDPSGEKMQAALSGSWALAQQKVEEAPGPVAETKHVRAWCTEPSAVLAIGIFQS